MVGAVGAGGGGSAASGAVGEGEAGGTVVGAVEEDDGAEAGDSGVHGSDACVLDE